jgi:hypothetical protein
MRRLGSALIAVILCSVMGCGTILYPERRGQPAGPIDAGVVLLDAVGLLVFFVPGVVAFAVDFATGAIYLPKGQSRSKILDLEGPNRSSELELERHPLEERTLAGVEAALRKYRGIDVDLRASARIEPGPTLAELPALLGALDRELEGDRLASR